MIKFQIRKFWFSYWSSSSNCNKNLTISFFVSRTYFSTTLLRILIIFATYCDLPISLVGCAWLYRELFIWAARGILSPVFIWHDSLWFSQPSLHLVSKQVSWRSYYKCILVHIEKNYMSMWKDLCLEVYLVLRFIDHHQCHLTNYVSKYAKTEKRVHIFN